MTMLVVLDHSGDALDESALEALTAARDLGAKLGESTEAVVVGAGAVDALAEAAGAYGAETLHAVSHELLADYGPDAWGSSVMQLADELDAEVLIAVGTDRGNEVLANVAARSGLPFVANALSIDVGGGIDETWSITRVQWGGSLLEDVTLTADRKLVSFAHHSVPAEPVGSSSGVEIEEFSPELDESVLVTMIADRDVATGGITLSTSPVVVGGGRGVGSVEGFGPLEELAELLGGVVGCSRAVTNNGWRPHTDQVGQTGTRIAPELYIAAGISGAIQHWVGAMASKKILAINTDPEANMVTRADYAVLADLHKMIPAISEEIRRRGSGEG